MKLLLIITFLLFGLNVHATEGEDQVECLAKNIYHEARGESTAGMFAVGFVTLNRVMDSRYPNTICGVVKQNKQFSWYSDGLSDKPTERQAWKDSIKIAHIILFSKKKIYDFTEGATHYHSTKVNPFWVSDVEKIVQIENHIFYIWES